MRRNSLKIVGIVIITALIVLTGMFIWHLLAIQRYKSKQDSLSASKYKEIEDLNSEIDRLKSRIVQLEENLLESHENIPADLLKVYSYNASVDIGGVGFCLVVPDNYSISDKIKFIAEILVKYRFSKGMIQLKKIEKRDGKKIAVLDLRETKDHPDAWKGCYFQGSAGGRVTTFILIRSFLQPDYTGEWIDGVEFYYEGQPIDNNAWDHIGLGGAKFRK